jgi:hypothetical protein
LVVLHRDTGDLFNRPQNSAIVAFVELKLNRPNDVSAIVERHGHVARISDLTIAR